MSIVQNIIDNLKNQGAKPDFVQIELINLLSEIKFNSKFSFEKIFKKDTNMGFYIWGDVGRGKTLITKTFLSELKRDDIKCFHFIDLINFIHNSLNDISGSKNPIEKVVKYLIQDASLIFIDEFQVEDVADAMIIGDLLKKIVKRGIKIIMTSNAHPQDLYKDGLQRQKFLTSLNAFLENIEIFKLDGEIDYRTRNIIQLDNIDKKQFMTDLEIFELIRKNFGLDHHKIDKVEIMGRKFSCKHVSNNILWIEYINFFNEPTHAKDYKYLTERYDWIFISNFIESNDDLNDVVRRFISFIDIAYISNSKIKLFLNEIKINEIYSGSKIDNLWSRCLSRLNEMQTDEYFTKN